MNHNKKNQKAILEKLKIEKLNPMQEETHLAIHSTSEVLLLSPTGTGKTLAFLLPIISELDEKSKEVQVLILAPSRELAIQIEQVAREMGTGYKINAFYGGQSFSKDRGELNNRPSLLVGTPGRIADHLRRGTFTTDEIKTLVLDEFDKSLEIGFEDDMVEIVEALPALEKKILTSATQGILVPKFVGFTKPLEINYLNEGVQALSIKRIVSPDKDKLETLVDAIYHLGNQPGIVFCNFRDSIERVSVFLKAAGIQHGCFHGGMEQRERERSLIQFRNGTYQILIATDLAARGIDVPEIQYILHYHLPSKKQEFTHRNGRTARMKSTGTAYVLHWEGEELPEFIPQVDAIELEEKEAPAPSEWNTVFVSGGRRDKISKGDIAGLFFKQGELKKDDVGLIELKQDCAFVAVKAKKVKRLVSLTDNSRLKKKKVRIYLV